MKIIILTIICAILLLTNQQNLNIPTYCTTYVQVQSGGMGGGNYVRFYVNNVLKYDGQGDGIHFALFNEAGTEIEETIRFQTGSFGVSGHVRDMADWLNAIPNGRSVVAGINWEAAMYMTFAFGSRDAYNALKSIGAKSDVQFWLHDAYALIGRKGAIYSDDGVKSLRGPSLFPGKVDIHGCIGGCGENARYIRAISEGGSKGNKAEIHIDGQNVFTGSEKGTMIYVLDDMGNFYDSNWQSKTIKTGGMIDFVNSIPNGYTVIVTVKGSSTWGIISFDFFQSCGGQDFSNMLVDEPYALIGTKGGEGMSQKEGCCGVGKIDIEYCVKITPCAPQCAGECSGSPDNCTGSTCQANRINFPTCECPSGTYTFGDLIECQPCAFMCTECNEYANQCVGQCSHPTRDQNTSDCACLKGYYQVNENIECEICDYKCKSCETSNENCLECSSSDRDINNGCQCKSGMFEDENKNCQSCAPNCDECSGNSNNCLACLGDRINAPTCECPFGTFAIGQENICNSCDFKCSECSNQSDSCLSCSHPTRDENTSSCLCKTGFFQVNSDIECQQCDYKCISCENSSTECLQCLNENRDISNSCNCNVGYFENENLECQKCSNECATCENSDSCISCKGGLFRDTQNCECDEGYFDDGINAICQQCSLQCKSCTSSLICIECVLPFYRPPSCSGFTAFAMNQDEENLDYDCGPLCLTCPENNPKSCDICRNIPNRNLQSTPNCECLAGYHDENNTDIECKQCSEQCETCSNSSSCNTCASGLNRSLNPSTLQCDCEVGFKENSLFLCQECYQYNDQCYFECPESTIIDNKNKICIEQEIVEQSHTSIILLCGGLVLFALIISGIFSKILPNKLSYEQVVLKKQQQKDVEDISINDDESEQSQSHSNKIFPDPSSESVAEISEL